jgi:hypothetical protein
MPMIALRFISSQVRSHQTQAPSTNGRVERMNCAIKDATIKRFYYETHDELQSPLADFISAYNFAEHLKTLKGLNTRFCLHFWFGSLPPGHRRQRLEVGAGIRSVPTACCKLCSVSQR